MRGFQSEREDTYLQFGGDIEATSAKAVKFQADGWDEAEWIPRSQINIVEMDESSGRATIQIKEWLCKKNGWEE